MLNLKLKNLTLISIFCFLSIFGFGQTTKNMAPDLNSPNSKSEGMRINSNLNYAETNNTTKSAQKQFTQSGLSNHADINYEKDAVFANRKPQDELVEKRDRTSKHFQNPDGTIEAFLSTGSVNYYEKGAWLTIERAILPNNTKDYPEYEYANTKNSFKTYLSKDQSKGIKTVVEDQEITEWQNKKIEFLDENFNTISLINAENGRLKTDDAKAIYSNIFPYTEAHITQLFDGRKIDYEISSPEFLNHIPANSKYLAVSEDIVLPKGWTAKYYIDKLNENPTETTKQISIFNEKDEEILRYMPPAYFEKNNEHDIENPVGDYEIEQIGQILTIKILVDADWFRNESREFPVVIDPTASVYPNNASNWTRSVSDVGTNYHNSYFGYVDGSQFRSFIKFNLSTIPIGSTVNSVNGYIKISKIIGNYTYVNNKFRFNSSIDPTTNSNITLYNSASIIYSNDVLTNENTGLKMTTFNSDGLNDVENSFGTSLCLSVIPSGTYHIGFGYSTLYQYAGYNGNPNRPYLSVSYTVPTPCSGTPTGGTASMNPTSGTHGSSFTASVTGSTAASGISYQWESAPSSSGPWTGITGATLATYTANAPYSNGVNYYRRKITCSNSGENAYSNIVSQTTTCTPQHSEGNASGGVNGYIGIKNVALESINYTTGYNSTGAPSYNDYTSQSTNLFSGNTYTLQVTYQDDGSPFNPGKIGVWVDWNNDGDFSDENEWIGISAQSTSGNQVFSFNVSVPTGIAFGSKRLRVRSVFHDESFTSIDACTIKEYGETEDYNIEVIDPGSAPDCATLISPLNEASGHSLSDPLEWNAVANADDYDIYFGEDNPPVTRLDNTANTSYDLTNLDYSTTYYWQILPTNAGGSASGCDVWSFTTGSAPPQFHNYGGSEQLTFNNAAYKVDAPNFRISHPTSTMDEVQIQISQDVTFSGETVFDGNFTGSFISENNFETSLSGAVLDNTQFPQAFDTDVLTHGATAPNNSWFAPNSNTPIAHVTSGGNPSGRVGYSSAWNNYWGNFLRLPEVDATGMDEIILSFDVWHSYSSSTPNNKVSFSIHDGSDYKTVPQTVLINGVSVESSATTGGSSYAFKFSELREGAHVEVTFDISSIANKSNILFYLNATCAYNNGEPFSIYFDNVDVTGAAQEFTNGDTYYARARGKIADNWTDWTSETHSFTYKNQTEIEWHQTAEPQLKTNTLSDVITQSGPELDYATIPASGGTMENPINDPSFESGTEWSVIKNGVYKGNIGEGEEVESMPTLGSACLRLYPDDPGSFGYFAGDYVGTTQEVDLTGIDEIIFDLAAWHKQPLFMSAVDQSLMQLRIIIGNQGTTNDNSGSVLKTYNNPSSSGATQAWSNEVIDVSSYTGNHTIKFVSFVTYATSTTNDEAKFYLDNIRVASAPLDGTLTSAPINLPSFYQEDTWYEFSWNQTLNGGAISFSIEEDNAGSWDPVVGFTDFSSTTDGNNNLSIESIGSSQQIRLKATFTESGAKGTQPELNNWTIKTKKDSPLPVELLSFDATCNGNSKEFTWETASETNSDYFLIMVSTDGKYFVPVAKVQAAGHSSQNIKYNYTLIGQNDKTYYRLKQVDFDGNSETFNIIHVDCGNDVNSQITAYPNPFDGKILYLNSTSTLINSVINIYDALGRLVYQTKCDEINSHVELKIDTKLDPGAYYLEINSENEASKRISLIVK